MNKPTENTKFNTNTVFVPKVSKISDDKYNMNGIDMNSLEFFEMIKREWCVSEEQYRPFWNDVLTFARKYHKERKQYETR
jgi:tRNA A58 N-methylase Trm61